jgi:hypothetical protein
MSLFQFARVGEEVLDYPHVSIKVGTGCPAGCDCDFSYKKLKTNTVYSREFLLAAIELVDKNFSSDFEIFFVGLNIFKYEHLEALLEKTVSLGRRFKLQIPHTLDASDVETFVRLSQKYHRFATSIPKTIDTAQDLK